MHKATELELTYQRLRSNGVAALASAVGIACGIGSLMVPSDTKIWTVGGAVVSFAIAGSVRQNSREIDSYLGDRQTAFKVQRQKSNLTEGNIPTYRDDTSRVKGYQPQALFQWTDLKKYPDKYPHLAIVGGTGSGKTVFAEYLGLLIGNGKRYAICPKIKPDDFQGFDGVYGGGFNFGSWAKTMTREGVHPDYPQWTGRDELDPFFPLGAVSWSDITSGKATRPTIAQCIYALYVEMQHRYIQYEQGVTDFEPLDIYFDEYNLTVFKLQGLGNFISQIIMAARSVRIRLLLIGQVQSVDAMDMNGLSELRDGSLTFIYLQDFATNHAEMLVGADELKRQDLKWLKAQPYPTMVEDQPAERPTLAEMHRFIQDNAVRPTAFAPDVISSDTPIPTEVVEDTPIPTEVVVDLTPDVAVSFIRSANEMLKGGMTKEQIIQYVWNKPLDEGAVIWANLGLPS